MISRLPMPKLPAPENRMDRIAFAGPMCVGKTTLANSLAVTFMGYSKLSFANRLKSLVYNLYGEQEKNNQGRLMLQVLSDDLKKWDSNLFIKHLLLEANRLLSQGFTKLVVDDLRFKSEADALRKNGFVIIKVTCDEEVRQERIKKLYPDIDAARHTHSSERSWENIKYDYTIDSTTLIALFDLDTVIVHGNSNRFYR